MGLQLSGGPNVNTTFTCTVGTRLEIVAGIEAALISAGWTVISGGGSADVLLQSGLTPQGLQCRVRLFDQGSGNCARIFIRSVDGLRVQSTACYLLPAAAKVFRVIACPYHFFVFTSSAVNSREFAAGGTLWVPAWSGVTEAFWSHCNAESDSSATLRPCFRQYLDTAQGSSGNTGTGASCVNGSIWTAPDTNNYGGDIGGQRLVLPLSSVQFGNGFNRAYRFLNNAVLLSEPLMAWGQTNYNDEAKIMGQLFDAYVCTADLTADSVKVVNSRNFHVVTSNNQGVSGSHSRGSLLLLVP